MFQCNKWSKNFDERPDRHLVTPRGGKCIRPTLTPYLIHASLGPHESAPKRHLDRFSRFCIHHCKVSQCFSMGQTTPKNCPFSLEPPSNTWFFGPNWVSPQTSSLSIQPFSQGSWMWPTDRLTDRPRYSMCSNRLLLLAVAAMQTNNRLNSRWKWF